MKHKIHLITFLLISTFIVSCSSNDDFNYQNDFENSQNAWFNFKESSNNSYKYVVSKGSVFTPYGWETTITVSNGVIIQRNFKYTGNTEEIPDDELEWTENENEINSQEHEDSLAAEALTLDDIYLKAEQDWLLKRKNATSYFESKNNGLISTCGYVVNGCMDDCFVGITIKSIISL
jgi:predicted ATP-binding protein involved in virulence